MSQNLVKRSFEAKINQMTWKPDIKSRLDQLLDSNESEKIAVFDADGTLWHDDLGEAFFKFQIENKLAPGLKNI